MQGAVSAFTRFNPLLGNASLMLNLPQARIVTMPASEW